MTHLAILTAATLLCVALAALVLLGSRGWWPAWIILTALAVTVTIRQARR